MPLSAEFEEKEYERPLYTELTNGSWRVWTPGHVLEHHFGADAALHVVNPEIWNVLGYPVGPRGVIMADMKWGWVWRARGHRPLPSFEVNLFIQSKRPQRMKNRPKPATEYGLRTPYWRFRIEQHQQRRLEQLRKSVGHRAPTVYAAPAFHRLEDLYHYMANGSVVEQSCFIRVEKLSDHEEWLYDSPGSSGVGMSEAELIEDESLEAVLAQASDGIERTERADPDGALEVLEEIAGGIRGMARSNASTDPRSAHYAELLRTVEALPDVVPTEIVRPVQRFIEIALYTEVYGITWAIVG